MALSSYFPRESQRNYWDIFDELPQLMEMNDLSCLPQLNQQLQPWRLNDGAQQNDENRFAVRVDMSHFTPQEISVKIVDNDLVIKGKHKEKMDKHGWVSRQFTRRYVLPDDCDPNQVQSSLSSKGILSVEVRKKAPPINSNERVIHINVMSLPQPLSSSLPMMSLPQPSLPKY